MKDMISSGSSKRNQKEAIPNDKEINVTLIGDCKNVYIYVYNIFQIMIDPFLPKKRRRKVEKKGVKPLGKV